MITNELQPGDKVRTTDAYLQRSKGRAYGEVMRTGKTFVSVRVDRQEGRAVRGWTGNLVFMDKKDLERVTV